MTEFAKTSSGRKLRKKPPPSEAADTEHKGKRQRLIIASLVIAVIVGVVWVGYDRIYQAPFRQPIIVLDDTSINMRYFLKRTHMANQDPETMLWNLTSELLIKQVVPQPPYNIKVTAEDIDAALREVARGGSATISDSEFREWYRQQLNATGLSDAEFRDLMRTTLLKAGLYMYLAEQQPTMVMQVYLHAIFLDKYTDAEAVRARLEAGEDFTDLAREVSTDEVSAENGGDIGWFPRDLLGLALSEAIIGLDLGEVTRIIEVGQLQTGEVSYALIMISETAAREPDEDALAALQEKALEEWFTIQMQFHKVELHGFDKSEITGGNVFGSETIAWINWQLQKMAE